MKNCVEVYMRYGVKDRKPERREIDNVMTMILKEYLFRCFSADYLPHMNIGTLVKLVRKDFIAKELDEYFREIMEMTTTREKRYYTRRLKYYLRKIDTKEIIDQYIILEEQIHGSLINLYLSEPISLQNKIQNFLTIPRINLIELDTMQFEK